VLTFSISALRSIIELLGLALVGQGMLYLIAGQHRAKNPIYQFFALLTRRPQQLAAKLLPRNTRPLVSGLFLFLILFTLWIALAWLRKSL
jgi:hypothetical protein